jgi:hypothetical protein
MSEEKNDGTQKKETLPESRAPAPDHSLPDAAPEPPEDQAPEVYAVTDLRALVKPEMAEELTKSTGGAATCSSQFACSCVPVETCACNVVTYAGSVDPGCSCQCTGTSSLYWYPY